ncbi:unnamed protein product [Rhizopus stolonifer]
MDDIDFYTILNLNKNATVEDIKKSYRKLALRYHPDKNPHCEEQFRLVLSDPRNRRIYDRYGMVGLNMVDSVGPSAMLLDPEISSIVLAFFGLISILLVCLIVWLVFVCLKVDGTVNWPWHILFIPIWLADGLVLWITLLRAKHATDQKSTDDEEEELLNEGQYKSKKSIRRYFSFVEFCFIILFQVLVVAHLDGSHFDLPLVILPYAGFEIVHSFSVGKSGCVVRIGVLIQLICLLQHEHWAIIFIPTYFLGVFYAFQLWWRYKQTKIITDQELAQQAKTLVIAAIIIYGLLAVSFYTILGLIIAKLEGVISIKLSLIFIPVFLTAGFMLCCSGCCLPCMLVVSSMPELEQEVIDPNRRITASTGDDV